MKLTTALAVALLFAAGPVSAQTPGESKEAAPAQHTPGTAAQPGQTSMDPGAPPTLEKVDPAKEAAIRHLMEITETSKMGDSFNRGITNQVRNAATRAIPADQLSKFMDTFSQKFEASAPPSAVTDAMVPIYAKHFSLEDLQAMTKFYESPAGQRAVKTIPEVVQESQSTGAQIDQKAAIAVLRSMSDEYPQLKPMLPPDPNAPTPPPASAGAPATGTPPGTTAAPAPGAKPASPPPSQLKPPQP